MQRIIEMMNVHVQILVSDYVDILSLTIMKRSSTGHISSES